MLSSRPPGPRRTRRSGSDTTRRIRETAERDGGHTPSPRSAESVARHPLAVTCARLVADAAQVRAASVRASGCDRQLRTGRFCFASPIPVTQTSEGTPPCHG